MKTIHFAAVSALFAEPLISSAFTFSPTPFTTKSTKTTYDLNFKPSHEVVTSLFSAVSDDEQKVSEASSDPIADSFELIPENHFLGKPIPYSDLTIGVVKETYLGENRVSLTPESVSLLTKAGLSVVVEIGGEFLSVAEYLLYLLLLLLLLLFSMEWNDSTNSMHHFYMPLV